MANFLNFNINSVTNTTQGMRDRKEKIIPNIPADEGTIIKNPEANPHRPTDLLNLVLYIIAHENSKRHMVLKT
ncbi:hypothetical protein SAMN05421730_10508 [Anaerobium acetethylicum]|uniref:Uncharacterized protein n=1 Tax=Anaerobium acetethylicum TaxID=1619234 RepID=A0A1D3TYQ7_9FIRM|nr:hypothetical protein SAMN05421730_10508 [Anaerobium acetethylicum]